MFSAAVRAWRRALAARQQPSPEPGPRGAELVPAVAAVEVQLDRCLVVGAEIVPGGVLADVLATEMRCVHLDASGAAIRTVEIDAGPMCVLWPAAQLACDEAVALVDLLRSWSLSGAQVHARSAYLSDGGLGPVSAWAA